MGGNNLMFCTEARGHYKPDDSCKYLVKKKRKKKTTSELGV